MDCLGQVFVHDSCISWGWFFGLVFRSYKVNSYTSKYGIYQAFHPEKLLSNHTVCPCNLPLNSRWNKSANSTSLAFQPFSYQTRMKTVWMSSLKTTHKHTHSNDHFTMVSWLSCPSLLSLQEFCLWDSSLLKHFTDFQFIVQNFKWFNFSVITYVLWWHKNWKVIKIRKVIGYASFRLKFDT